MLKVDQITNTRVCQSNLARENKLSDAFLQSAHRPLEPSHLILKN